MSLPCRSPRGHFDAVSLPSETRDWGYSFSDVPGMTFSDVQLRSLGFARIVTFVDEWRNTFPLILDQDENQVSVAGTSFHPGHRKLLRENRSAAPRHYPHCSWITQHWAGNYCHWLLYHLTALQSLMARVGEATVLLPAESRFSAIEKQTILEMQLPYQACRQLTEGICTTDNLIILDGPSHHPELLLKLGWHMRTLIAPNSRPRRRLFISRENASWRRLDNESELWTRLAARGFEKVALETISFAEQVRLFAEAQVVVATHGAGLANTLFCQPGTKVIEIGALDFPCADYYRLALSIDLDYWWMCGESIGDRRPGYRDMRMDPLHIETAVSQALEEC